MGPIAELLLRRGFLVSGSDVASNAMTQHLRRLGAFICKEHKAENIKDADVVVYSTAIASDNPELLAAKEQGIRLLHRAQMLAELMSDSSAIAVSGTHGKTTTSCLLAHIFMQAKVDPSFIIGGVLRGLKGQAGLGGGEYFIAEADESDASMLYLNPKIVLVTNIDADHMETYAGDFNKLKQAFLKFIKKVPDDGVAIVCIDDPVIAELLPKITCRVLTYGFSPQANYRAQAFEQKELISHFVVQLQQQDVPITLNLAGQHNVLNALAAIACADFVGIQGQVMQKALVDFPGVGRRLHVHGKLQCANGEALLIDDYGHHPREIEATFKALRAAWPTRRIVLLFQPHRYSRTKELFADFVQVLSQVDVLVLLPIYAAGEQPIANISSQALAQAIEGGTQKNVIVTNRQALPALLQKIVLAHDVVLLQGAGDIVKVVPELLSMD